MKFWDKLDSKVKRVIYWGSLLVGLPSVIYIIYEVVLVAIIIMNIAEYVNKFESIADHLSNNQNVVINALIAEMESKEIYGVTIEETNPPPGESHGDYWVLTTVIVNDKNRPALFKALFDKKKQQVGYIGFDGKYHVMPKDRDLEVHTHD